MSAITVHPVGENVHVPEWRGLYLTALFETDRTRLPGRIYRAQRALLRRERELFVEGSQAERVAVTGALHGLHALRRCLGI